NPFHLAKRIELLTYNNRMEWWFKNNKVEQPLVKDGKLNMPLDSIQLRVKLDAVAVNKWQSALYGKKFCKDNSISFCYEPRHLLLFYDSNNKVLDYIEICLSCAGGRISKGL